MRAAAAQRLVDKTANQGDVYELVRLAYAFPEQSAKIDDALVWLARSGTQAPLA